MNLSQRLSLSAPPLYLMDGTAFIYRSFYANRHLRRSDGYPTNALTLVTRVLLRILRQEEPQNFLFVMDGKGYNLRKDIYEAYKANREAMPEDLTLQIDPVKNMVEALGLPLKVMEGHEADDCIASLAAKFSPTMPIIIISGDKDLKQCLGPNVFMWDPGAKEEKLLTSEEFTQTEGVTPAQWPDVQALTGDSSDNIPGVPGIGPKTARQIFTYCDSLEDIRDHLDRLPPKLRERLEPHIDEMFTWRKLTTLNCAACQGLEIPDLRIRPIDLEKCQKIANEFELSAIYREITALASGKAKENAKTEKADLQSGLPKAKKIANVQDLPDAAQKAVAIVWPDGLKTPPRVFVASESSEDIIWQGKMADLCEWVAQASRIIVPDFKELLTVSPSWRKLHEANHALPVFDLALTSWLLDPDDENFAWPKLANRWEPQLGTPTTGPAELALLLADKLGNRLAENGLTDLYKDLELPLAPVLAKMQETGFAIDPAAFRNFLDDVQKKLDELTVDIFAAAGESFNIRSSQKLGEILFGKLGFPAPARTKTGQPSTSQATLEKLATDYPVIDQILEYRKLDKMRSTYLDPLPRLMDEHNRIHSTFNQEATGTGRISSSDPNLQNIPVRGPLGQRMRACFVPASGNLLIAADYSQIELRILAHFSEDKALLDAFHHNEDIHSRTASLIFDVPREELKQDQRRMAKTINFGLLYGMGSRRLAQELKISGVQAKEFIDRYFEKLAGLKGFYARVLETARDKGYVQTIAGRRRWLPGIHSDNGQMVAQAERQAVNSVIQGSAADIMKRAMIKAASDEKLLALGARLVLQVHDELLLEAPEKNAEEAGARVAEIMRYATPQGKDLSVPLLVDWGVGHNWSEAH